MKSTLIVTVPHGRYFLRDGITDESHEFFCLFNPILKVAVTLKVTKRDDDFSNTEIDISIVDVQTNISNHLKALEITQSLSKRNMIQRATSLDSAMLRNVPSHFGAGQHNRYPIEENAKEFIKETFQPVMIELFKILFNDDTYEHYDGLIGSW